jgi:UDP-N-acetylmuramate-alanine ligase
VAEADESDGSFLLFKPEIGVVTNIEVDHVDFYTRGRDEIEEAFGAFICASSKVVAWGDDPGVSRALALAGDADVCTYGTGPGNDVVLTMESPGPGGARGYVETGGHRVALGLRVDGLHNLLNATGAMAVASLTGVALEAAAEALGGFSGVRRRFEHRGNVRGADFFDDYGHVPTELAVTLEVARRIGPSRLVAVFQPHRYSRTKVLWRELGASLTEADLIVVTDVYPARQEPIQGVTGELVVEGIREADPDKPVVYCPHRADVARFLMEDVREGDLVITMGCGDVWMLGDEAMERIRESG